MFLHFSKAMAAQISRLQKPTYKPTYVREKRTRSYKEEDLQGSKRPIPVDYTAADTATAAAADVPAHAAAHASAHAASQAAAIAYATSR